MNTAKTALVVTTVVAIGLACIGCTAAANQAQVAQAQPATPTPAARPSALTATAVPTSVATAAPTTRVTVLAGGDVVALEPGRRYALASNITNPEISFVAPAGWTGNERLIGKEYGDGGAVGPLVFSSPFDHGFKDPCKDHTPV